MKLNRLFVALFICAMTFTQNSMAQTDASSQPIRLISGTFHLAADAELTALKNPSPQEIVNGRFVRLIQFHQLPMPAVKAEMKKKGIELLDYIPENAYIVSLPISLTINELKTFGIKNGRTIFPADKRSYNLQEGNYPSHAQKVAGKYDYAIRFYPHVNAALAQHDLANMGIEYIGLPDIETGEIVVRCSQENELRMAQLAVIRSVDFVQPPHIPDFYKSKGAHRSNILDAEFNGGLRFDGTGFGIGVGDDGPVGPHIDFTGRLINGTNYATNNAVDNHGDYTGTCLGAAGNLNPSVKGSASGATLISYAINGYPQITQAVANQSRYNAYTTNTSYAQVCNRYDGNSAQGDNLGFANPKILHFFSAGNNGSTGCLGVTDFGNITGGMKLAKNVMAIGSVDSIDRLDGYSSKGPSFDGRIKPEVVAVGSGVIAAGMDNTTLGAAGGTSFSAPHAAGAGTQLYHVFSSLNSGQIPDAALIKSVMMNTADDLGNDGPDYRYGFGRVNVWRAYNVLKNRTYQKLSVGRTDTLKTVNLTIPTGTRQVRVMAYWHDPAGSVGTSKALINDIDMTVKVGTTTYQPWTLSTVALYDSFNRVALRGDDHLNNVEQITFDDPSVNSAQITIKTFILPSDTLDFYLTWEFVKDEIKVVHPNGGEGVSSNRSEIIRWDAPFATGTFDIDVTYDNGTTWSNIRSGVSGTRLISWVPPTNANTGKARVRVTRTSGTRISDESDANFTIAPIPQNLKVEYVCPDTTYLSFTALPTAVATTYQIHKLGARYMDSVMRTDKAFFGVPTAGNVETWFSIRTVLPDGGIGQRAIAIQKKGELTACPSARLDIQAIRTGQSMGTTLYACQANLPLSIWVKNFSFPNINSFRVGYKLDNNTPVSTTLTAPLAFRDSFLHTFTPLAMPAVGNHTLKVWTGANDDSNAANDTLTFSFVVRNAFTSVPLLERFENAAYPPLGFNIGRHPNSAYTWEKSQQIMGADATITTATVIDGRSNTTTGTTDSLFTWLMDLRGVNRPALSFDLSYAPFSISRIPRLAVLGSKDCGKTFTDQLYLKSRIELWTNGGATVATAWTPTRANHWRRDTVDISAYKDQVAMFSFVYYNANDNRLFLDNINVDALTPTENTPLSIPMLAAAPNPSQTGAFDLLLRNFESKSLTINVFDAAGRTILVKQKGEISGNLNEPIDLRGKPSGVYMLQVQTATQTYSLKLTIL